MVWDLKKKVGWLTLSDFKDQFKVTKIETEIKAQRRTNKLMK